MNLLWGVIKKILQENAVIGLKNATIGLPEQGDHTYKIFLQENAAIGLKNATIGLPELGNHTNKNFCRKTLL